MQARIDQLDHRRASNNGCLRRPRRRPRTSDGCGDPRATSPSISNDRARRRWGSLVATRRIPGAPAPRHCVCVPVRVTRRRRFQVESRIVPHGWLNSYSPFRSQPVCSFRQETLPAPQASSGAFGRRFYTFIDVWPFPSRTSAAFVIINRCLAL